MKDKILGRVEGIDPHKWLERCRGMGVRLSQIRYLDQNALSFACDAGDWEKAKKAAGNLYKIKKLGRKGPGHLLKRTFVKRKGMILGLGLFLGILWYQSGFVSQVEIHGAEGLFNQEIRWTLAQCGIQEGRPKAEMKLEEAESMLYQLVNQIAWAEIRTKGNHVIVEIARSKGSRKEEGQEGLLADRGVCHVVAAKDGFIEEIVPESGTAMVSKGDYVTKGTVLISGRRSVKNDEKVWYERAQGSVKARVLYSLSQPLETVEEEWEYQKGFLPGLRLSLGRWRFDTSALWDPFEHSVIREKNLLILSNPMDLEVSLLGINEVEKKERERSQKELERLGERALHEVLKNLVGKDASLAGQTIHIERQDDMAFARGFFQVIEDIGLQEPVPAGEWEAYERQQEGKEKNASF